METVVSKDTYLVTQQLHLLLVYQFINEPSWRHWNGNNTSMTTDSMGVTVHIKVTEMLTRWCCQRKDLIHYNVSANLPVILRVGRYYNQDLLDRCLLTSSASSSTSNVAEKWKCRSHSSRVDGSLKILQVHPSDTKIWHGDNTLFHSWFAQVHLSSSCMIDR